MKRYLLNSAVLTAFGQWDFSPLTPAEASAWLAAGPYTSTIGYPETARGMETLCGLEAGTIPVNRQTITMQPGDEALVFRLVFPSGFRPDPAAKGALGLEFVQQHSECGLLRRIA